MTFRAPKGQSGRPRAQDIPGSVALLSYPIADFLATATYQVVWHVLSRRGPGLDNPAQVLENLHPLFTTSNAAVFTVSPTGLLTAVGAGTANLTITLGGFSDMATLTVQAAGVTVASVDVAPATRSVAEGGTATANAIARDAGGNALLGKVVTWASATPATASVGADSGTEQHSVVITGVLAGGPVNITATCETIASNACAVTVTAPPTPGTPSATITMTASRSDGGSGAILVNHAVPLQPAMMPAGAAASTVAVDVNSVEVQSYVEVLEGRFPDGSARALLLQYNVTLTSPATTPVTVRLGVTRVESALSKALYATVDGRPAAVGLPTSPAYLCATEYHAARSVNLIPVGSLTTPTAAITQIEADFDTYSDHHATGPYANEWNGGATASYDRAYSTYQHWLRTGDVQFWLRAVRVAHLYRVQFVDPSPLGPGNWHGQSESAEMYYRATGDDRVLERVVAAQLNDGTGVGFAYKLMRLMNFYTNQTTGDVLQTQGYEARPKARALMATVAANRIGLTDPNIEYAQTVFTQLGYIQSAMVRQGEWPAAVNCGDWGTLTGSQLNYMVGMLMGAVIEADAFLGGDGRALDVVSKSLTWMWGDSWTPASNAFVYNTIECSGVGGRDPYGNLNMFMAFPAYWLAYHTNSQTWFDRAEAMMVGVNAARSNLIYPKTFDQTYYRYADAMAYRQAFLALP